MAGSSSDEAFVERLARALHDCRIEAVVVGVTAAVLQGAPLTTQDVDLLIRRTPKNEAKIALLCNALDFVRLPVIENIETLRGVTGQVDVIYDAMTPNLRFESVRSRASRMTLGGTKILVASLEDVIRSKRAAGRPKDIAALPTLEDTLRVRRALEETRPKGPTKSGGRSKRRP